VLPSVNVPVAMNCCVVPDPMDGPGGFTVIETSVALLTVRVVEAVIEPDVAEMLELPVAMQVVKPALPVALLVDATEILDEAHCTMPVTSWVLPSLKVPLAVNCWMLPTGAVGFAGLTVMPVKTAVETVSTAELLTTEPSVAVIVVEPGASPAARPALLMVAVDGVEEPQLTDVVRTCVLPSLNKPVAVNGRVVPAAMAGLAGATVMAERVAGVTVSSVELLTEPAVAVMVA